MEEIRVPKTSKRLISMLQEEQEQEEEEEEEEKNLEEIKNQIVADSYDDETLADEEDNCIDSNNSRRKEKGKGKRASPDNRKKKMMKKKKDYNDDDRVNPEDYPELGKYLKQELMEDEAQQNWTVIGNHNAKLLQKQWVLLMDKQITVSLQKMDLLDEIYSFIMDIIQSKQ